MPRPTEITGTTRYERSVGCKAYRAGHYGRDLTVKAGRMSLRVPKLKGVVFSSAVIDRCRRREESAQGGAERHVPGRLCFVKRWCAVLPWVAVRVTGQLFTGLPSAGFVWFWLFCYCMRAWVRL